MTWPRWFLNNTHSQWYMHVNYNKRDTSIKEMCLSRGRDLPRFWKIIDNSGRWPTMNCHAPMGAEVVMEQTISTEAYCFDMYSLGRELLIHNSYTWHTKMHVDIITWNITIMNKMIVSILSNTRLCIALREVIAWAFPVDPIEQFDLFKIKTFM